MPTVLRIGPYRFFFFAADHQEPPHIHVKRDASEAKFWLTPLRLQKNQGFGRKELWRIEGIIEAHLEQLMARWEEFFND